MTQYEVSDVGKMASDGNVEGLLQAVDAAQSIEVRKAALEALGETRDKRVEKILRSTLTDPEKAVSGAAMAALMRYSLANAPAGKRRARPASGDPFQFRREKIATFVVGAIVVTVCLIVMFLLISSETPGIPLIFIVPFALIYFLGMAGWDWELKGNPYSREVKTFLFAMIAISVIGLIPISYWVGKTVFDRVFR
ncbi:MAG: HEAT repeat domain-containing protein [Anaerolineaceae bacterium]|nr:HEAT repeat domain-containing protein [Anaerolineaceae bacterium]